MFSKEVYVNRRNALKAKMNSGVLLFLGTPEIHTVIVKIVISIISSVLPILIWLQLLTLNREKRLFSEMMLI